MAIYYKLWKFSFNVIHIRISQVVVAVVVDGGEIVCQLEKYAYLCTRTITYAFVFVVYECYYTRAEMIFIDYACFCSFSLSVSVCVLERAFEYECNLIEEERSCCMRNWFACVYHSTQSNQERSVIVCMCTAFHLNWWPQFNLRFVCTVVAAVVVRPTHKQSLYISTRTLFRLFVLVLSRCVLLYPYVLCISLYTMYSIFSSISLSFLVFVHGFAAAAAARFMLVNVQFVRTRFCVFTFLSLRFSRRCRRRTHYSRLGECKNCARNKNKPSK